jgi:hypothetical protein
VRSRRWWLLCHRAVWMQQRVKVPSAVIMLTLARTAGDGEAVGRRLPRA